MDCGFFHILFPRAGRHVQHRPTLSGNDLQGLQQRTCNAHILRSHFFRIHLLYPHLIALLGGVDVSRDLPKGEVEHVLGLFAVLPLIEAVVPFGGVADGFLKGEGGLPAQMRQCFVAAELEQGAFFHARRH